MYGRERRNFAPVNVGDEIDLKIEAVGAKGDGIAKVKGFVIFVPSTQIGQECRVRITRVLRKVGFGECIGEASGPVQTESKPAEAEQSEEGYSETEAQEGGF